MFGRSIEHLALLVSTLALIGTTAFGAYQYGVVRDLETQLGAITAALGEAGMLKGGAFSQDLVLTTTVEEVAPAVVSIVISKDIPKLEIVYENPFGNNPRFREFDIRIPTYRRVGTERQQTGAGTGFIVREDGYIVTNSHVVDDTEAEYTVLLSTGEQETAQVAYRDQSSDLALLKIEGSGYPTVPLGDSSALELGQTVVAIGNALGEYSNSVSVGIVSGLDRTVEAYSQGSGQFVELEGVIQTDAAINLGNSGGPLFNLRGEAVGVNVVAALGADNIAFAIPINSVKDILARVL